jgi:hypothetical protein
MHVWLTIAQAHLITSTKQSKKPEYAVPGRGTKHWCYKGATPHDYIGKKVKIMNTPLLKGILIFYVIRQF